jgi:hypothetical protein
VQLEDGGFTIGTTIFDANLGYFAFVAPADGGFAGYWNGESGDTRSQDPAWTAGQPRPVLGQRQGAPVRLALAHSAGMTGGAKTI